MQQNTAALWQLLEHPVLVPLSQPSSRPQFWAGHQMVSTTSSYTIQRRDSMRFGWFTHPPLHMSHHCQLVLSPLEIFSLLI